MSPKKGLNEEFILERKFMKLKQDYQRMLDQLLTEIRHSNKRPSLLLHSCCAPCSSYVLEYLAPYFAITVFFFNPNIHPDEEYRRRKSEQQDFLTRIASTLGNRISFLASDIDRESSTLLFQQVANGLEQEPEGGKRCYGCYHLRLNETAKRASLEGFQYFTTTLSISPLKNATWLHEIGLQLQTEYSTSYLPADFKKRDGFKRSLRLSKEYNLYRQKYCGCSYSVRSEDHKF